MASSTNNNGNPWDDRRGRAQFFRAKYGTGPRNQNTNIHPPYGQQQQWSPYQQHPYAPPVTYVNTTTVYGGYAPPPGHYPFNQWGNSNQYMPPGFTPYPAAHNSSWGQPAPPMPYQQGPYNGDQARQRAPPRQPPTGFVSEEVENAASSSNIGVASQRPVPQDRETHVAGRSNQPGTPQPPLELPDTSFGASVKTSTVPKLGSEDTGLQMSASIRDVQQINVLESWFGEKEPSGKVVTERPKTPASTVASRPSTASRPTERPRTAIATVPPGEIQGSKPTKRPTTLTTTVTSTPSHTPALEMAQRPKTAIDASMATQSPTITERSKILMDTVTSIPPQASKPTQRLRISRIPVAPAVPQGPSLMERARSILKAPTKSPVIARQRSTTTSATSPSSSRPVKPSTTTSCGTIDDKKVAEVLAFVAQRRALREGNMVQPSSASLHASVHHELYEPKEIAKPTLDIKSREAPKEAAQRNNPIVYVISDSPISSSAPSLDIHVEPKEAPKQADLQDEPIYDDISYSSSSPIRSSPLPSNMEIDTSHLADHQNPPRQFGNKGPMQHEVLPHDSSLLGTAIDGRVKQSIELPFDNKRKRMTPSHFEPENESQEEALQKDLPAAKRVQHTEQEPSKPIVSSATERILEWQQGLRHPALPATERIQHSQQVQKPLEPDISTVIKRGQPAQQLQESIHEVPLEPRLRRSVRKSAKGPKNYCDITPSTADAMMRSTQDTSSVIRPILRAEAFNEEFSSSESSFNPNSPDSESFADGLEPPFDIEYNDEFLDKRNSIAAPGLNGESDFKNNEDRRPTQLTSKKVLSCSQIINAIYEHRQVQVKWCRSCCKWRDVEHWKGPTSTFCGHCKPLSEEARRQFKKQMSGNWDKYAHYPLDELTFVDDKNRILLVCFACAGYVYEEDMWTQRRCLYHHDRKKPIQDGHPYAWDEVSREFHKDDTQEVLRMHARMRGLPRSYMVGQKQANFKRDELIEALQKYNQRLAQKMGEEAAMGKIGVGRLQPSVIISIIRFSSDKNQAVATKWHNLAAERLKTKYCVDPTNLPTPIPISARYTANHQSCWLFGEHSKVRSALKRLPADSSVAIIIKGRDGLFLEEKPWRELWDKCGTKNISLIYAEPLSRFNEEVLTGWEGDMQDGHLWIRFELRDVLTALQGNYKSILHERLIQCWKGQSDYRSGMKDAVQGRLPNRNRVV